MLPWGILAGVGSPKTFELISTQIVSGTSTVGIFFTNIPQQYKHLQLRITGRFSSTASNNRTGSMYLNSYSPTRVCADHNMRGNGTSVTSSNRSNVANLYLPPFPTNNSATNNFGSVVIDILDYSSTAKNKTARMLGGMYNTGETWISLNSGFSIDTNAITSLDFSTDDGGIVWVAGSRFSLYGIRG